MSENPGDWAPFENKSFGYKPTIRISEIELEILLAHGIISRRNFGSSFKWDFPADRKVTREEMDSMIARWTQ